VFESLPPAVSSWAVGAVVFVAGAFTLGAGTASTSVEGSCLIRKRSAWTSSGASSALLQEAVRPIAVPSGLDPPPTTSALVLELRRLSGLTWDQLASVFGVDRRSVHFWAAGRPMNAANAEKLAAVLSLVRRMAVGDPRATRTLLLTPTPSGVVPLDALRAGDLDRIAAPAAAPAVLKRPPAISSKARTARAPQSPERLLGSAAEPVIEPVPSRPGRPISLGKRGRT
jgi:DNA-binding transcriptional regulator YiaG